MPIDDNTYTAPEVALLGFLKRLVQLLGDLDADDRKWAPSYLGKSCPEVEAIILPGDPHARVHDVGRVLIDTPATALADDDPGVRERVVAEAYRIVDEALDDVSLAEHDSWYEATVLLGDQAEASTACTTSTMPSWAGGQSSPGSTADLTAHSLERGLQGVRRWAE